MMSGRSGSIMGMRTPHTVLLQPQASASHCAVGMFCSAITSPARVSCAAAEPRCRGMCMHGTWSAPDCRNVSHRSLHMQYWIGADAQTRPVRMRQEQQRVDAQTRPLRLRQEQQRVDAQTRPVRMRQEQQRVDAVFLYPQRTTRVPRWSSCRRARWHCRARWRRCRWRPGTAWPSRRSRSRPRRPPTSRARWA